MMGIGPHEEQVIQRSHAMRELFIGILNGGHRSQFDETSNLRGQYSKSGTNFKHLIAWGESEKFDKRAIGNHIELD